MRHQRICPRTAKLVTTSSPRLPAWLILLCTLTSSLAASSCQLDSPTEPRPDAAKPARHVALPEQEAHEHGFAAHVLIDRGEPSGAVASQQGTFLLSNLSQPVQQLGFLLTATSEEQAPPTMQWRGRGLDGIWTAWQDAEITWKEGRLMVGRAALAHPADEIELRAAPDAFAHARVELFDTLRARATTLARDLPFAQRVEANDSPDGLLTRSQAVAPASLVISRADWGARNPSKICGNIVKPYRVSVHHTAQPDSDGEDPAARLRQMQAYHIDTNGWCDIGYHFVVSQSGKIYQGRSDERRPGAHVGGQNSGNIGVSFIGNYQANQPPQRQLDAGKKILDWIRTTYNIQWDRTHVKGHREWPGQSTSCPGSNLLAKLPDLMDANPGTPVDPPKTELAIEANWLMSDALEDRLTQGSSQGLLDALPGANFQAEFVLSNTSEHPIRGVKLGYLIEHPYLRATSYTIQTDAPQFDRATWMTNDADAAEENPAKDALGKDGELTMYAFAAGETKRVLIDLEAARYSIGQIDHPDARVWVRHIDGVYEGQSAWNEQPTVNTTGQSELLQAFAQLDIPSPRQWQFDAGEEEMLEGWRACPESPFDPAVDVETGSLLLAATSACITSPPWTDVNADVYDEIVLRLARSDASTTLKLTYAAERDALPEAAPLYVEIPAQATERVLVLSMAELPSWGGRIDAFQLETIAPASGSEAMLAIDAIFFQSSEDQSTSAAIEDHVALPYTPISTTPPESSGETDPDDVVNPGMDPMNPSEGGSTDGPGKEQDGQDPRDTPPDSYHVKDGCNTTAPHDGTPSSPLLGLLVALGALLHTRRNTRSRS